MGPDSRHSNIMESYRSIIARTRAGCGCGRPVDHFADYVAIKTRRLRTGKPEYAIVEAVGKTFSFHVRKSIFSKVNLISKKWSAKGFLDSFEPYK